MYCLWQDLSNGGELREAALFTPRGLPFITTPQIIIQRLAVCWLPTVYFVNFILWTPRRYLLSPSCWLSWRRWYDIWRGFMGWWEMLGRLWCIFIFFADVFWRIVYICPSIVCTFTPSPWDGDGTSTSTASAMPWAAGCSFPPSSPSSPLSWYPRSSVEDHDSFPSSDPTNS